MDIKVKREILSKFRELCKNNFDWFTPEEIATKCNIELSQVGLFLTETYGEYVKPNPNYLSQYRTK